MVNQEYLTFPAADAAAIESYLPHPAVDGSFHLTLTWATSMDSYLSSAAPTRTIISGPESKAMTHYLRSRHDAILVGYRTAIADDPSLNCRTQGVSLAEQPLPIVLDPYYRWAEKGGSRLVELAKLGLGKRPVVIGSSEVLACMTRIQQESLHRSGLRICDTLMKTLGSAEEIDGGENTGTHQVIDMSILLSLIASFGCRSVMIEGGARLLDGILGRHQRHISSIIVTMAPKWFGAELGRAPVRPPMEVDGLKDIKWRPLGQDVVLLAKGRAAGTMFPFEA